MTERRQLPRIPLRCPVQLWSPHDGTFTHSVTENLTGRGFFCLSEEPYSVGDELEATLELPTRGRPSNARGLLRLQCKVSVIRISGVQGEYGVACRVTQYSVIRPVAGIPGNTRSFNTPGV